MVEWTLVVGKNNGLIGSAGAYASIRFRSRGSNFVMSGCGECDVRAASLLMWGEKKARVAGDVATAMGKLFAQDRGK